MEWRKKERQEERERKRRRESEKENVSHLNMAFSMKNEAISNVRSSSNGRKEHSDERHSTRWLSIYLQFKFNEKLFLVFFSYWPIKAIVLNNMYAFCMENARQFWKHTQNKEKIKTNHKTKTFNVKRRLYHCRENCLKSAIFESSH